MTPVNAGGLAAMTEDLRSLVSCESPSEDLAAVARSAEVVGELGERLLAQAPDAVVIEGRTHVRWQLGRPSAADRQVLLLGHHDTVWPVGSLEQHPWRVAEGRAFGPGCFDMKAGLVQLFHALALLRGQRPLDGVTVLVTGDEELGAPTSHTLIEEAARAAGLALVLEASADGGALKVARKGVSAYEIAVRGRAAHAGLEPEKGINAGVELARIVLALTQLGGVDGTTVTPTASTAGTAANTVPAAGRLSVDVRAWTRAEQDRVDAAIVGLRPRVPGASIDVRRTAAHPPLERTSSAAAFELARAVAEELGMPALLGAAVGGGSDGNLAAGAGAATLDGLGAVGGGAHAPGEHVELAAMPARARLLAGIVARRLDGWSDGTNPAPADGGATR